MLNIRNSQYVWEAMHSIFPIAVANTVITKLPVGEEGKIIEPVTIKRSVGMQYLGQYKTENIKDSGYEHE